jgi:vesicle transport through interaction with t-SNAREs protein 1
MSNLIDADAGTERFGGYEAELKLVQADLNQQIEQIKETTGEPRKAAISRAERALEEADELVSSAYWSDMRRTRKTSFRGRSARRE